ncbi:sensor histidine kinase [Oceanobacillus jeddahense]|uniref:histidine kinase n=1 Tax=Oceanobacillus jeddahense TaxID=1462527 RepID=A0ABY5JX72_9BACI|nr:HAMP domain-containing sensor histidine kinase [Oceanobacillus jeddahense]UUI04926.1 HAMP domain-containing histidine kinase [Oceanobacillus jeddahense]
MKKLRGRLFFHFSIQFGFIALLMIVVVFLATLIGGYFLVEMDRDADYYQYQVEELAIDVGDPLEYKKNDNDISDVLKTENMWLQIIDEEGNVIESENVPADLKERYNSIDIAQMKEREQLAEYSIKYTLEKPLFTDTYLFVLGYQEQGALLINELIENVNTNGSIAEADQSEVEETLNQLEGTLAIYDDNGDIVQQFGSNEHIEVSPLEMIERDISPDHYDENQYTLLDRESGNSWILTVPSKQNQKQSSTMLKKPVFIVAALAGAILVITLLISFWNSFRYGSPLFIFANWLNRMGNGNYKEVLTEQEKKKVYRKNGKLKRRYKLYKEVFQAFDEMAVKLDASQKEREQLEKSREEWVAGISHDLRTPLTTMEGYGRMLGNEQYEWSEQELQEIGDTITEKSGYMVDLIEDFTLSFRLKNDANTLTFNLVSINESMEQIIEKFRKDVAFKDYPIVYEPVRPDRKIEVNERLFERMIDNLMYNAWKHNPQDTAVKVEVTQSEEEKGLEIRITDNGTGMDEETQKHLFTRYYRGTNTEERNEGTGLGMSIALQIAKLHQGTISVQSEKDRGTTVTVFLPVDRD